MDGRIFVYISCCTILAYASFWSYALMSFYDVPLWWLPTMRFLRFIEPVLDYYGLPLRNVYLTQSTSYNVERFALPNDTGAIFVSSHQTKPRKVLFWIHGGVFVSFSDPASYLALASGLLLASPDLLVVLPQFRTAPAYPYPTPAEDCAAVIEWTLERLATGGGGIEGVSMAGDDSGANIAMAAIRIIKSRRKFALDSLFLVNPMAQIFHFDTTSMQQYVHDPLSTFHRADLIQSWLSYLFGHVAMSHHAGHVAMSHHAGHVAKLLERSDHVSAEDREKYVLLDKQKSQSSSINKQKYRLSKYYNPKTIRVMRRFITDPLISPLVDQTLGRLLAQTQVVVYVCDYSILRDDALFLYTYFTRTKGGKLRHEEISGCFTGSMRYPGMSHSQHVIKSIAATLFPS